MILGCTEGHGCFVKHSYSASGFHRMYHFRFVCLSLTAPAADHSALYTSVALCLASSLAVLALVLAFLLFKVDLVLAQRKLMRHVSKQKGKCFI